MTDLKADQARFIAVLQDGPAAFPDGLFAGEPSRALLGLKAHANTISHARLVALEQTYPRTLEHLGHATFNALSRDFIERPAVRQRKLMQIGEGFSACLALRHPDRQVADLAAVEWAWLESYHAADAPALALGDLAAYDEPGLLALEVVLHPASRIVATGNAVTELFPEVEASCASCAAILVTRPLDTVRLLPLNRLQAQIAHGAQNCATMGNLLQTAIETLGEAEALSTVFALIEAGVLARPGG
ncbi:putative DNA-binding domain-containing protein [Blastomonas sp. AAP25]|uniref:HvfC/BufC family peptide modification chaperone n=1 Tax=Blastomonas sp. AAP25 TaxID=1523416 RepID=UPI000A52FCAC|nr:putative DNA-binding domain-containing protein [Blastomonas sp. AAP25]